MKIVFLDIKTLGYGIDVSGLRKYGEVLIYDYVADDEVGEVIFLKEEQAIHSGKDFMELEGLIQNDDFELVNGT